MNLDDLVCTFEQAKKLNKLEVKIEPLLYWIDGCCAGENYLSQTKLLLVAWNNPLVNISYPAYTSAELLEIIKSKFNGYTQVYNRQLKIMTIGLGRIKGLDMHFMESKPEAQARAEFLIYLLENNK